MEPRYRGRPHDMGLELPSHNSGTTNRSRQGQRSKVPMEALFPKKFTIPIVLSFILLTYAFCRIMDNRLPTALTADDIPENPNSFIAERARNDLILFTGLGPRVCGSHANDISAVELLFNALREIDRTKDSVHSIEIDIQKPTGAFYMEFQEGLTSSYSSVPLVIAKLQPARGAANSSMLVNCHFDSVPGSPGASDDMINCVAMLEVLRVLSRQKTPLRNSIIFLFNGAEENGMQASHGFVAGRQNGSGSGLGHRFAKNLKAFVNLEASGAGGREVLFQTGPGNGWILQAYAKAPFPYGSVVGEEIFQMNLIPSDTDFRVFRDHAKIPGLDLAFIKNGWVYHTKYDNVDQIPSGSIQHVGANTLAIIEYLGNLDITKISGVSYANEKMVYYDIFGVYMVIYSETTSIIINILISVSCIYFCWVETGGDGSQILLFTGANLLAWVVGVCAGVVVAIVLNLGKYYMPYFAYPSLAIPLFGIPTVVAQVFVYSIILKGQEDQTWIGAKSGLAFLLLAFSFSSRALFSITINLGFGLFAWITARKLFKDPQRKLLYYLAVGEAFPLAMSMYLIQSFVDVFVPIMGRSGSETDPNIFVAILTAVVVTIPTFTGLVPIFVILKKTFYRVAAVIFLLTLMIVVLFIGKIPYSETSPMRLYVVEVDRTWYDSDLTTPKKTESGYWFFNIDPNTKSFLPKFAETNPDILRAIDTDTQKCDDDLYCGLPYYFPVAHKLIPKTQFLPKPTGLSVDLRARVRMDLRQAEISSSVRRFTLSFIGPDHLTVVISPGPSYELIKWSLTEQLPPVHIYWKNRPTYFVYHGRGINFERFEFTLELRKKTTDGSQTRTGEEGPDNALDITYSGFWLHGDDMKTNDLKEFVSKFPDWTYPLGWSASTHIYKVE